MAKNSTQTFYGTNRSRRNQTHKTRRQIVKEFVDEWVGKSKNGIIKEDANRQPFIDDLLRRVCGIEQPTQYIQYEKDVQVKSEVSGEIGTKQIDGYIPSTKVIWEMKGSDKDLDKPIPQSDGTKMTPYEQAKRYNDFLPANEQALWIVTSNFIETRIYDLNKPLADPTIIMLKDLTINYKALDFMVDANQQQIIDEKQLSVDAGTLVGKIYDELAKAYSLHADVNDAKIQRSLNMLVVRLVFLLYADDTGILGEENMFQNFLERRKPRDIRAGLIKLFRILDEDPDKGERDDFLEDEYQQFKYVNGGMFSDEDVVIPQFTQELKDLILNDASKGFNWSNISPTIFGAVFESTLNKVERKKFGMIYTSIENIHKAIDPLYLNDLRLEFSKIQNMPNVRQRVQAAREFQDKIAKMKFLDPACGSGNFLTETYLSLRKMENECLKIIVGSHIVLNTDNDIRVKIKIQNFYGIEINDFAVSVARTAMWIAESQMWDESQNIIYSKDDFLPLDSNDSIYEGNALKMDWADVVKPYELDYIIGNPPFKGKKDMTKEQKAELRALSDVKGIGRTDYVAGWFIKAAEYIQNTTVDGVLVATNSLTQGENAINLWNALEKYSIYINFAYRSFVWQNEAKKNVQVHCTILGFATRPRKIRYIFDGAEINRVKTISANLLDTPYRLHSEAPKAICDVPKLNYGNVAGYKALYFKEDKKDAYLKAEPSLKKFIRPFGGARDLLNDKPRYCFWLVDATPKEIRNSKILTNVTEQVYKARINSSASATRRKAEVPQLFFSIAQKDNDVIAIPKVTTGKRPYMPILMVGPEFIVSGSAMMIDSSSRYIFSILSSSVHTAWMRAIGGRMKDDYQYSIKVVYNTFPWPTVNESQKKELAELGQKILDARAKESDSTLAELYTTENFQVDRELRKAHEDNDRAVLKAYGLKSSATEQEIVSHLFEMYEKLTNKESN